MTNLRAHTKSTYTYYTVRYTTPTGAVIDSYYNSRADQATEYNRQLESPQYYTNPQRMMTISTVALVTSDAV